jgi:hypothetical protein
MNDTNMKIKNARPKYMGVLNKRISFLEVRKCLKYDIDMYWSKAIDIGNGMRLHRDAYQVNDIILMIGDDKAAIKQELERELTKVA